jgi:hypothetical protein
MFELLNVLLHVTATDAAVDLEAGHIVAKTGHHALCLLGQLSRRREHEDLRLTYRHVQALESAETENTSLACARLRLHNNVASLYDR